MTDDLDDLDLMKTRRADGQVILAGRYRVASELGRGGMGVVYLAEDLNLDGRQVALKMLPPVLARNAKAVAALKREALLAMQLSHPHIVTLRSFEQADEGVFLVMDYVQGRTLEQILAERERLTEQEVLGLFRPIAEALDYAHSKKVVHRDIKPSNILIASQAGASTGPGAGPSTGSGLGTPFIMDFGVAREMKDTFTRVTGKGTSGTLPYMSPEQLRGQPPTPAQDIYSLAATMYEGLSGHPPFHRGQIEYQIVNEAPLPLEDEGTGLVGRIMEGLSKQPASRPARCGLRATSLTAMHTDSPIPLASPEPTATPQPALPKAMTLDLGNNVTMKLVLIPAGKFMMGSPDDEKDRFDNEGPQHEVTITKPFYMGVYEVMQEQYEGVMGMNPSHFKGAQNPVENVSWDDAVKFCKKLSQKTGKTVGLPTEAQWEYACRAGSKTRFSYGDDNDYDKLGDYAWYSKNSDTKTHPVGQKKPNDFGLHDMHGNLWEWCLDWYTDSYANANMTDPTGTGSGTNHVLRGGGWSNYPQVCRSAVRNRLLPDYRFVSVGFRVSVDLK